MHPGLGLSSDNFELLEAHGQWKPCVHKEGFPFILSTGFCLKKNSVRKTTQEKKITLFLFMLLVRPTVWMKTLPDHAFLGGHPAKRFRPLQWLKMTPQTKCTQEVGLESS